MKAIWKTQDGREVAVKDMDDRHLANTIRMLERNAPLYKDKVTTEGYMALSMVQGEQAEWDIERDISRIEELSALEFLEEFVPVYKSMKWHASRRGVKL